MPRKKGICLRGEQPLEQFRKFAKDNEISYEEALQRLLKASEKNIEYQDCEFFGEYPPDSKHFIECTKIGKKRRTRGDCQACHMHKVIRYRLKREENLKRDISNLGMKKDNIETMLAENKQLKGLLEERNKEIAKKDEDMASLQTDYDVLKEKLNDEERQISKIEPLRSHQQVVLDDAPMGKTAQLSSEKITRKITEESKKVTEETIEKPVAQIKINNALKEAKVFPCSEKNREVNMDEDCNHCIKLPDCSDYTIANEKVKELS